MLGEGLVLVTSGDISCFRHSGRAWGGSEAAAGRAGGVGDGMEMEDGTVSGGEKEKEGWGQRSGCRLTGHHGVALVSRQVAAEGGAR